MSLIKDGKVYRTEYEQIVHLTEKHLEQETINQNVNRQLTDLSVASNLGGFNYVRFAFEKQGTYYKLRDSQIENIIEGSLSGDYFEISSNVIDDIPAYGYLDEDNYIQISFAGDFMAEYENLVIRNVTKDITSIIMLNYSSFNIKFFI